MGILCLHINVDVYIKQVVQETLLTIYLQNCSLNLQKANKGFEFRLNCYRMDLDINVKCSETQPQSFESAGV